MSNSLGAEHCCSIEWPSLLCAPHPSSDPLPTELFFFPRHRKLFFTPSLGPCSGGWRSSHHVWEPTALPLPSTALPVCRLQEADQQRLTRQGKTNRSLLLGETSAARAAPAEREKPHASARCSGTAPAPAMLRERLQQSCGALHSGSPGSLSFLLFAEEGSRARGDVVLIIRIITYSTSQMDAQTPLTSLMCAPGRAHPLSTCCWHNSS